MPLPVSGERITEKSCHCRSVENASRRNFPIAEHFGMRVGKMMLQSSLPRSSEPQPAKAGPRPRIKLSVRGCAFARVCTLVGRLLVRVLLCVLAPPRAGAPSDACALLCVCTLSRFCHFGPEDFPVSLSLRINRTRTVVLIASLPFLAFDGTIKNDKYFEVAHSRTA